MNEKYLIFGNGWIGNRFKDFLNERNESCEISSANITDYNAVLSELQKFNPDVIINCAGKTGIGNVDWCDDHKFDTMNSNLLGPLVLLKACNSLGKYLVHVGTGCIYEGSENGEGKEGKGFSEEDVPNFIGTYYSKTKFLVEDALKDFPILQLRIRLPVDSIPHPKNLINKLPRFRKIVNLPNSMTVLKDFFEVALQLIEKKETGIFNVVNKGYIKHDEILKMYQEIIGPLEPYELVELGYKGMNLDEIYSNLGMKRRANCVISTEKLESHGIKIPHIKDAIREAMIEYKKNLDKQKLK